MWGSSQRRVRWSSSSDVGLCSLVILTEVSEELNASIIHSIQFFHLPPKPAACGLPTVPFCCGQSNSSWLLSPGRPDRLKDGLITEPLCRLRCYIQQNPGQNHKKKLNLHMYWSTVKPQQRHTAHYKPPIAHAWFGSEMPYLISAGMPRWTDTSPWEPEVWYRNHIHSGSFVLAAVIFQSLLTL
jgi:hypothetical protein